MNFAVLWLFTKVFSVKFGGVVSFGTAQATNPRKFSLQKIVISPIRESFSPSTVSRYMVRPTVRCMCALFGVTCFINEHALISKIRLQQRMSIILHHHFCTQIAGMRHKHVEDTCAYVRTCNPAQVYTTG